jgi:rare lipoprotein A
MSLRILAASMTAATIFGLAWMPGACANDDAEPAAENAAAPEPTAAPESPAIPTAPTAAGSSAMVAMVGRVSYYGRELAGRKTSSGERFNPDTLTMAHQTLPFGTLVRVTNLRNNRSVIVRVNDRGPHTGQRIGDVSTRAARELHMMGAGVVQARLEVVTQR